MTLFKGSFIFRNDSAQGWSESLYSTSTSTSLAQMIATMKSIAPKRMKLTYGDQSFDKLGGEKQIKNLTTLIYIRVEDEQTRRDGQLLAVDYDGSYVPAGDITGQFGNWPSDWCTLHQWYAAAGTGPGQWALEYMHGIPLDATNYDGGQNPKLSSAWTTPFNQYFQACITANLGFKSLIAARAVTPPIPWIQPTKPFGITYNATTEGYIFTLPTGWVLPPGVVTSNTYTASIRGQNALKFLNGQRPVTYLGMTAAPLNQPQFLLARGRYPDTLWDNTGTFSLVQWVGVQPATNTFLGMHRRKVGRVPFVPRGRARVLRP